MADIFFTPKPDNIGVILKLFISLFQICKIFWFTMSLARESIQKLVKNGHNCILTIFD